MEKEELKLFKEMFFNTKGLNFGSEYLDLFFNQAFKKIQGSFDTNLEQVIKMLEEKSNELKTLNLKP